MKKGITINPTIDQAVKQMRLIVCIGKGKNDAITGTHSLASSISPAKTIEAHFSAFSVLNLAKFSQRYVGLVSFLHFVKWLD